MRLKLLLGLLLFGFEIYAQKEVTYLGPRYDYSYSGSAHYSGLGIDIERTFGDHFGVSYSLIYGPGVRDEYYFYTGGGQVAGVYLIREASQANSGLGLAITLGIISFILPERFNFQFSVGKKSKLGFFLAPYGFEFVKNRSTSEENYKVSYELGYRYIYSLNRWLTLVPEIGLKGIYGEDGLGGSYGLLVLVKLKEE